MGLLVNKQQMNGCNWYLSATKAENICLKWPGELAIFRAVAPIEMIKFGHSPKVDKTIKITLIVRR